MADADWEFKCQSCKSILYVEDKGNLELASIRCPECKCKNLLVIYYEEVKIEHVTARLYELEARVTALEQALEEKKDESKLN